MIENDFLSKGELVSLLKHGYCDSVDSILKYSNRTPQYPKLKQSNSLLYGE